MQPFNYIQVTPHTSPIHCFCGATSISILMQPFNKFQVTKFAGRVDTPIFCLTVIPITTKIKMMKSFPAFMVQSAQTLGFIVKISANDLKTIIRKRQKVGQLLFLVG
eukprot:TRINITY_DN691_c0_g1_i15.p1 TRINITY_DN691_c0_g1~~TRINITY_DN691_c0_g1_i15.p1  ORF type:complete len:107 (+),score=5.64 TRINITY_DN691_c0_g1_i15:264-584(+)